MKILAGILGALILLIQYPLWVGKGGWMRVWQLDQELERQKAGNTRLEIRNAGLAAEVNDLKTGTDAIEERARHELGFIRSDEIFFQYADDPRSKPSGSK